MYQKDFHLSCFLKALVFVVACMLVSSSESGSVKNADALRNDILRSDVRQIANQAIMAPETCTLSVVHFFIVSEHKISYRFNDTFDPISPVIHRRLISLKKIREIIVPVTAFRYLKGIPANKDDLPDLC